MSIRDFGHNSFITWTEADLRKERQEMDKYICLVSQETFAKDELHCCPRCGEFSCPTCGGEVQTIREYDEAMRINSRKES
jgi:hypothetical protein